MAIRNGPLRIKTTALDDVSPAAESDVAISPESFGDFVRSEKQTLTSLLSEALEVPAAESDELINLALTEAANRWDEAAIAASPAEWVLGYAVELHRTRRTELPPPSPAPLYLIAEQPAPADTRVTGALALAAGIALLAEASADYPQIAPSQRESRLDAESLVTRLYEAHYRSLARLADC